VAFLDDPSILDELRPSPDEVDHIFTHPLEAFLDPTRARGELLADSGSEDWPYDVELYVCTAFIHPYLLTQLNYRARPTLRSPS
jgi:coenzyme A diphosphatase NUDT7